ncbi:PREDICTED: uncharacterized protein LOC106784511 [Polistes canadensis]|uniref:uncharacterized protein LOC106784511 n=1 Tax=Polistes canadensis TaxID=91411 RepID=UPI000718F171|nr:PREDICTED: uncharacterized protein LOC106784511 [Polistes canadensis]
MADDPNRDLLPVKEGSCIDTCRSVIDPKERHLVCKLDRYQLEDKYLRLLEEANNLKKLSNCQEDKIKRLATKLMRVAANPRACVSFGCDAKTKATALEIENSKLKNKLSVLRSQLLSHTMSGVSPTRSRRPPTRPSSGLITCRSENSRIRAPSCQCIVQTRNEDNDVQNYLVKIEELETQKKEMSCRITQLEKELETYVVNNQRKKVVENIEYIKVWRQMKQLSDKLIAAQNTNESLNLQINDLKKTLEETTKNNQEITVSLMAEKKRIAEIDTQIIKAKDSQLTLREKDEQIRDLMNEMKILQQHNNELITLSSKYGQVELENVELKKKISQQFTDQQTLKVAFNTEQANIAALQTANEQLLNKLQYLQKNMDTLTIQLATIQNDNKKNESSSKAESPDGCINVKTIHTKELSSSPKNMISLTEKCKKCCEAFEKILQLEKGVNTIRQGLTCLDKCVQTDVVRSTTFIKTKEASTSVMTSTDERSTTKEQVVEKRQEIDQVIQEEKNPLSREKMLKLLDQAQISTPLKTGRIGQLDVSSVVDCEVMQDFSQRHRQVVTLEKLLFGDSNYRKLLDYIIYINKICQGLSSRCALFYQPRDADVADHVQKRDLTNLLAMLGDVLREERALSKNCSIHAQERNILFRNPQLCDEKQFTKDVQTDINNNNAINWPVDVGMQFNTHLTVKDSRCEDSNDLSSRSMKNCSIKRSCNQNKSQNHSCSKVKNYETRNQVTRFTETGECTCTDSKRCHAESDCGYFCSGNYSKESYKKYSDNVKNPNVKCSSTSPIKISDNKYPRKAVDRAYAECYVDDIKNCFESWKINKSAQEGEAFANDHQDLQSYVEHLEKCKEFLDECNLKNTRRNRVNNVSSHLRCMEVMKLPRSWNMPCQMENQIKPTIKSGEQLRCDDKCPNECIEVTPYSTKSIPFLITNGQGLVEIHVISLQLATSVTIFFQEENLCNVSLFISWNIWGQETVRTPTLKCSKLNFNSSFVYHIPNLFVFFNCVLSEYVIFQANVVEQNTTAYSVARAKLCIKDILDYPQNKLHYIAPMNSVIACTLGTNFGQLSLWVRLSCDVEQVDAFKKQCGLFPQMEQIGKTSFQEYPSTMQEDSSTYFCASYISINLMQLIHDKKEIKNLTNSVIGQNDNKLVNDTNNDGSSDSEIIYKPVTTVKKEEEEEREKAKKTSRDNTPLEKDTIVIQIASVNLFENSSVMRDDDVHLLYVEYSFLGYRGADMETESLPKPKIPRKPLIYNFTKTFPIDEKYHAIERNTLRAMLDESINPNIKFILVSEPLPEETDTKDCMEIGYAYFNIREYALGDNNQSITLPISNPAQTERIGVITHSVTNSF